MKRLLSILSVLVLLVLASCDSLNPVDDGNLVVGKSDTRADAYRAVETQLSQFASTDFFSKASPKASKVTGSGHVYNPDYRTFSFSAIGYSDGSAKGQYQLYHRKNPAPIHGTVECVTVDGNTAWFAGPLTKVSDPAKIGVVLGFLVVDNGEGGSPDRISGAKRLTPGPDNQFPDITTAQQWCDSGIRLNPGEIENGNVQVH